MTTLDTSQAILLTITVAVLSIVLFLMGPIGWIILAGVWLVAVFEAFTEDGGGGPGVDGDGRDGRGRSADEKALQFCPNCGEKVNFEIHDAADTTEEFHVNYCGSCGAPLVAGRSGTDDQGSENEQPIERENCPECGVLNGVDRTECRHCHSSL